MSWTQVVASFESEPEDWSIAIELFRMRGCENTLLHENPPQIEGCFVDSDVTEEQLQQLRQELTEIGATSVMKQPYQEKDWDQVWKQHFVPRRIGRRLVLCPSWESYAAEPDDVVLLLDPGQAFGTGEHPTTRRCLELLETLDLNGKTVLDLGCGSGVLAIAAAKFGAAKVDAIDVDPIAVQVTIENMHANSVLLSTGTGEGFTSLDDTQRWDVIVSNIISATLIRLAPHCVRRLKPGGTWIVSGIIVENWPDVQMNCVRLGLTLTQVFEEDGWIAASWSKPVTAS
jgi:ribosomal protein L11 methyltransferase